MPYQTNGSLTTDKRVVDDTTTWDTQSHWEAYQSKNNVELVNGSVQLADAIPDSAIDRFVASDFDSATGDWPGTQGNYTLTGGSPTLVQDVLNGQPAVRFDGSSDYLSVSFTSAESQPNTIFIVGVSPAASGSNPFIDGSSMSGRHVVYWASSNWAIYGGETNVDGSTDSGSNLFTAIFDGASSVIREDGAQTGSGNPGSNGLDGITLGAYADQSTFGEVDILEVVPCNTRLSPSEIDAEEQRLADKYGITL